MAPGAGGGAAGDGGGGGAGTDDDRFPASEMMSIAESETTPSTYAKVSNRDA